MISYTCTHDPRWLGTGERGSADMGVMPVLWRDFLLSLWLFPSAREIVEPPCVGCALDVSLRFWTLWVCGELAHSVVFLSRFTFLLFLSSCTHIQPIPLHCLKWCGECVSMFLSTQQNTNNRLFWSRYLSRRVGYVLYSVSRLMHHHIV